MILLRLSLRGKKDGMIMLDWTVRGGKAFSREWVLSHLGSFDSTDVTYTGLPASTGIFESLLAERLKTSKIHFELFETDPEIFESVKTLQFGKAHTVRASLGDVDDYVLSPLYVPGQILWLDYCGPINSKRLRSLAKACKNLKGDSKVVVTFMSMREQPEGSLLIKHYCSKFCDYVSPERISGDKVSTAFFRRIQAVLEEIGRAHV